MNLLYPKKAHPACEIVKIEGLKEHLQLNGIEIIDFRERTDSIFQIHLAIVWRCLSIRKRTKKDRSPLE
ncbi:hypothetical protein UJ203_18750 [Bacillus sp. V26]|uniref:hypothetical protein n=1 Tax=Bacillus sp. V26 TaxID=3098288 RepID=UPI002AAE3F15|nr:hypothetical protein [Bacillus sp. V26]MDY7433724.1 hypothetical protein [Bacillus sp. V26]